MLDKIERLYYNLLSIIKRLKRSAAYAILGYNNWDFDALTIERYLLFKLKRVEKALVNGNCDLTVEMGPKKMKAIKLTIKLLERLAAGDYRRFMDAHDAKWGEMVTWFEPTERGDGSSYWRGSRPKANTPELKEVERKEFLEAYIADDRQQERDRQLVYKLIAEYIGYWWD